MIYEWIAELRAGDSVLDLGSGPGSFPTQLFGCSVVALDEDPDAFRTAGERPPGPFFRILGQSARLPFRPHSFDLIICHHVLEHIEALEETLAEIARVLKPAGRLYIAIPDGHGFCDQFYRWIYEGGGHVNRFRRNTLVTLVQQVVGIRLVRWKKLYSSFIYLYRLTDLLEAPSPDLASRLLALQRVPPSAIRLVQRFLYLATRFADRIFRTDLAVYGWALCFERCPRWRSRMLLT